MSAITRTWLALAAVATGLIHVALVTGAPLAWAIVLGVLGVTEFGWGVLSFARPEVLVPRVAIVVAIAPVLGWALLLVASTASGAPHPAASLGVLPLGIASLFELFVAAALGAHLRRDTDAAAPAPRGPRYALGLAAAVLVIAGLTAPALAAVQGGTPRPGSPATYAPDIHGH